MNKHVVIRTVVAAAVSGLMTMPLIAQGRRGGGAAQPEAKAANVSQRPIKRLADGTPDIRGTWNRVGGGMNEVGAPDSELKAFGVLSDRKSVV